MKDRQRYSFVFGRLVPIVDDAPPEADRRCPQCGVEGVPDSAINERLFYCDTCDTNYFLR